MDDLKPPIGLSEILVFYVQRFRTFPRPICPTLVNRYKGLPVQRHQWHLKSTIKYISTLKRIWPNLHARPGRGSTNDDPAEQPYASPWTPSFWQRGTPPMGTFWYRPAKPRWTRSAHRHALEWQPQLKTRHLSSRRTVALETAAQMMNTWFHEKLDLQLRKWLEACCTLSWRSPWKAFWGGRFILHKAEFDKGI